MGIIDGVASLFSGSGPETNDLKYQEALSYLLKYDVGRTSYFQVDLFGSRTANFGKISKFLCHTAELPGEASGLTTQKIYGVVEKFPLITAYNDLNLAFLTHGSSQELTRNSFLNWLSYITGRGEILKGFDSTTYNLKYKDSYTGTIQITQYAITGEPLLRCELYEVFPVAINQAPLNWASPNNIQSLNVTFAFTEYQYTFYNVNGEGAYSSSPLGEIIGMGIQGAAAINSVIGAIKSGNPAAILSNLPGLGLSNFTLSSATTGRTGI